MPCHVARERTQIHSMKGFIMKKFLFAFAAAAGIAAVASHAMAQGQAPHHGPADPVAMIATLKDKLSLNTSQQQQFDGMVAQTQAARQAARAGFDQIKAATQAELAKAEPDLAALAAQVDVVHQQNDTARKTVRAGWLALYATFDASQKAVVRDAFASKLARMEQFRAHMMQRLGQ